MNKCGCGSDIHPERYALGYKVCLKCGDKNASRNKPYGYVHYGHKTAGSIVITSKKGFDHLTHHCLLLFMDLKYLDILLGVYQNLSIFL